MSSQHHTKPIPYSDAYLNFVLRLSTATQFDMADYANWVRDNVVQLVLGFERSDEIDKCVYARMQYSRSKGLGV